MRALRDNLAVPASWTGSFTPLLDAALRGTPDVVFVDFAVNDYVVIVGDKRMRARDKHRGGAQQRDAPAQAVAAARAMERVRRLVRLSSAVAVVIVRRTRPCSRRTPRLRARTASR